MTATTVDINTKREEGKVQSHPVAAATTIYLGTMVALNASGYLVSAADSSALRYQGIAAQGVDNSAGANGAERCKVYRDEVHQLASSGLAITDVGKPLYCSDNQTVTLTPTAMFVGILAEYVSATIAKVDIEPATRRSVADNDGIEDHPVAATANIAAGNMVGLDATGYLVNANAATCVKFIGKAREAADNSAGADGALNCQVDTSGVHNMTAVGLTQADVGRPLYVSDVTTVTLTPGNVRCGTLAYFSSAVVAPVKIDSANETPTYVGGVTPGSIFTICATFIGAIGAVGVKALEDLELPFKYRVLRGYADAQTAPGGAYVCTITLTDGTTSFVVTITGAATHGENETAGATPMLANTDTDINLVDDNASGATADVKVVFICQAL